MIFFSNYAVDLMIKSDKCIWRHEKMKLFIRTGYENFTTTQCGLYCYNIVVLITFPQSYHYGIIYELIRSCSVINSALQYIFNPRTIRDVQENTFASPLTKLITGNMKFLYLSHPSHLSDLLFTNPPCLQHLSLPTDSFPANFSFYRAHDQKKQAGGSKRAILSFWRGSWLFSLIDPKACTKRSFWCLICPVNCLCWRPPSMQRASLQRLLCE